MQFLYSKNNGKGGGVKVNKPDLQVKYETLERISKQVENKGLGYALDKTQIYEGINSSGVKDGTKEGLLKEAGFTSSEVQALRDKKVTNETPTLERKALERMNSAVEVVNQQVKNIRQDLAPLIKKGNIDASIDLLVNKYKLSSQGGERLLELLFNGKI